MKTSILSYFLLILITINITECANLALHSRCISNENVAGLCVHIKICDPVMERVLDGTIHEHPPSVCNPTQQTVCCPLVALKNIASRFMTTGVTQDASSFDESSDNEATEPQESSIKLAAKKCEEYGDAVMIISYASASMLDEEPLSFKTSKCLHLTVPLIVGGESAFYHEFPHQALIGYKFISNQNIEYLCGGSLVSPNFVLTAAHCLNISTYGPPSKVKLGMNTRNDTSTKVKIIDVEKIHRHPSYERSMNSLKGDIALLELKNQVAIDEYILPVCLPTKKHNAESAIVTGFGKAENNKALDNLQKVILERFTHEKCQKLWKNVKIDKNSMICYGHHTEERDSCKGDSGGPIQLSNDHVVHCTYTQIGIVSFGLKNCGTVGFPGVYVDVFNYLDWIVGIIWKDEL